MFIGKYLQVLLTIYTSVLSMDKQLISSMNVQTRLVLEEAQIIPLNHQNISFFLPNYDLPRIYKAQKFHRIHSFIKHRTHSNFSSCKKLLTHYTNNTIEFILS